MQSILETVPQLSGYAPSLFATTLLTGAILIQSFLAGVLALGPGHQVSGMPLNGDHSDKSFRVMRTYGNSTENLPALIAAIALAIIAGVGTVWVNWLVGLHVAFRLAHWAIYYSGKGKVGGGIRTIVYVLGLLTNFILIVLALIALAA